MELLWISVGFIFGVVLTAMFVSAKLPARANAVKSPTISKGTFTALALLFVVGGMLLGGVSPAAAQTPVPLEIPVDVIFTETNTWLATFAPIAAIGIGIGIALAVLGYLGNMIKGAFRA